MIIICVEFTQWEHYLNHLVNRHHLNTSSASHHQIVVFIPVFASLLFSCCVWAEGSLCRFFPRVFFFFIYAENEICGSHKLKHILFRDANHTHKYASCFLSIFLVIFIVCVVQIKCAHLLRDYFLCRTSISLWATIIHNCAFTSLSLILTALWSTLNWQYYVNHQKKYIWSVRQT